MTRGSWRARAGVGALLLAGAIACSSPDPVVDLEGLGEPSVLAPEAYEDEVAVARGALRVALDRIAQAAALEAVEEALIQAEAVVRSAGTRLASLRPPPERRLEHLDLIDDMGGFSDDLSQVSMEVRTLQLCAAPSVVARISRLTSAGEMRAHFSGLLPDPQQPQDRRPPNGEIVLDQRGSGDQLFHVTNPGDQPAVVTLAGGEMALASIYVASGQEATIDRLPNGTFTVYFMTGEDWDQDLRTFTRSCRFARVDQPFTLPGRIMLEAEGGSLPVTEVEPADVPGELHPGSSRGGLDPDASPDPDAWPDPALPSPPS